MNTTIVLSLEEVDERGKVDWHMFLRKTNVDTIELVGRRYRDETMHLVFESFKTALHFLEYSFCEFSTLNMGLYNIETTHFDFETLTEACKFKKELFGYNKLKKTKKGLKNFLHVLLGTYTP